MLVKIINPDGSSKEYDIDFKRSHRERKEIIEKIKHLDLNEIKTIPEEA